MRRLAPVIAVLSVLVFAVSGCDFFRRAAGRPTSAEIEAKKVAILREANSRKDSVKTAARDTVRPQVTEVASASAPKAEPQTTTAPKDGKKRFYIVMASFSSPENAAKCAERMAERGYPGELLGFKGGYTGVGICGTDDEAEAKKALAEIKRQDFCPEGVWIIDRNKR